MDFYDRYDEWHEAPEGATDEAQEEATVAIRKFFEENKQRVFSSRQLDVTFEDKYFHWITHRVVNVLKEEGTIQVEPRKLAHGAPVNMVWHRKNRYVKRQSIDLIRLIDAYSHPDFTAALGNTGELLVSDGFGRFGFQQRGRHAREYNGKEWTETDHDLDFVFARDGREYGVEVKNTLPYITSEELAVKLRMCDHFGLRPLFVVRAMPRIWIQDIWKRSGFTLMLRHQLYPLSHRALAVEVREKMGLPVEAPKALYDGTMNRFVKWHEKTGESVTNSHWAIRKSLRHIAVTARSMNTYCLVFRGLLAASRR